MREIKVVGGRESDGSEASNNNSKNNSCEADNTEPTPYVLWRAT